tara:strand:- start:67 stop:213 length:147 start_codon:yes stop_codon:yes gene_type:complete
MANVQSLELGFISVPAAQAGKERTVKFQLQMNVTQTLAKMEQHALPTQ